MQARGLNVVVTGASAGVGRAVARRFAAAGARLGLIGRDGAALEETARELAGSGHAVAAVDVSDDRAVFEAAERFELELGPVDVWINNAMLTVYSPVARMTPKEFRLVTETTYLGYVHGTMAALKHMRARNRGMIVQVGSSLGYRAIPLQSAYCGAKHAIRGFTDALRSELIAEDSAIGITMVNLPAVDTPQFNWARSHTGVEPRPVPPVVRPEVAADAIFEAAFGGAREYWLGFSTAQVILGSMVAPAFMDRYLARNAISAQGTGRPLPADRRDNLEAPVRESHRIRGSFGHLAQDDAILMSGTSARAGLALAGALLAIGGLAAAVALGRRGR